MRDIICVMKPVNMTLVWLANDIFFYEKKEDNKNR